MKYAFSVEKDGAGVVLTSRDFPSLFCPGDSVEDALKYAPEGLEAAVAICVEDRQPVPMPSAPQRGDVQATLPLRVALKVALSNGLINKRWKPADLAKAMGTSRAAAANALKVGHNTGLNIMGQALEAVGLPEVVTPPSALVPSA
ncbi:hypothetical protein ACKC9G_18370 [Pokkaliibacter sp. CJK22405]|uniref:hypothetical protein n=1 Tax=Pokkaliibacter sp. CJK22405 TaxID=3384615 RepID=UPI0039853482